MTHIPTASYPICPLCSEHIELEKANTDDKGKAVHEECYVLSLKLKLATMQPAKENTAAQSERHLVLTRRRRIANGSLLWARSSSLFVGPR